MSEGTSFPMGGAELPGTGDAGNLSQTVTLYVKAPGARELPGLQQVLDKLRAIDALMLRVNRGVTNLGQRKIPGGTTTGGTGTDTFNGTVTINNLEAITKAVALGVREGFVGTGGKTTMAGGVSPTGAIAAGQLGSGGGQLIKSQSTFKGANEISRREFYQSGRTTTSQLFELNAQSLKLEPTPTRNVVDSEAAAQRIYDQKARSVREINKIIARVERGGENQAKLLKNLSGLDMNLANVAALSRALEASNLGWQKITREGAIATGKGGRTSEKTVYKRLGEAFSMNVIRSREGELQRVATEHFKDPGAAQKVADAAADKVTAQAKATQKAANAATVRAISAAQRKAAAQSYANMALPAATTPHAPPVIPTPSDKGRPNQRDMVTNIGHITAWAAGAAVLYGTLGLVRFSLQSLIKTGLQTARLQQIMNATSKEAMVLRDSVLGLAAAYGRTSEEAMRSTVDWARLGLTKVEINEAVRVSLMAANVAEISAAEATQHLQAIMLTYGLNVGQLAGVLGELNQISNTYAVTNNDMLTGISRTAAVAKQAGLPLEELMGIIGATVGQTKQSGANIGNAIKSIITSLGNPKIQELLKSFKIDVRSNGEGDMKNMSQVLQELYLAYQKMTKAEQQWMLYRVAGKTQSSRMTAILDGYVKAQVLAIDAQLNLNSAENENKLITASLSAQLKGLVTEWERFVSIQGSGNFAEGLGTMTEGLRNLIAMMNTGVGSSVAAGFLSVLTLIGARLAITGLEMVKAGQKGGFLMATMGQLRNAWMDVGLAVNTSALMFAANTKYLDSWKYKIPLVGGSLFRLSQGFRTASGFLEVWGIQAMKTGGIMSALGLGARAVALSMAAFWTIAVPILAVYGAFKLWNWSMEALGHSTEGAQRKLAGFNKEAEDAAQAAKAYAQAAKLIRTADEALKNPNLAPAQRKNLMEAKKALKGHTAEEFEKEHAIQSQVALNEKKKALEHAQQMAKNPNLSVKERTEWERRASDAVIGYVGALDEASDSDAVLKEHDLERMTILEKHKALLESISEIYKAMPVSNEAQKNQLEIESLKAKKAAVESFLKTQNDSENFNFDEQARADEKAKQIDAMILFKQQWVAELDTQRQAKTVPSSPLGPGSFAPITEEQKQLLKDIERLKAEKDDSAKKKTTLANKDKEDAKNSIEAMQARIAALKKMQAEKERIDRANVATNYAGLEAEGGAVGATQTDKAISKRKLLNELIQRNAIGMNVSGQQEEAARFQLLQNYMDLYKTEGELRQRGIILQREEKQLMIDKNREFQKSLMMAGPGDLLKKIAAMQFARRPISAGQWFAMDPSMREQVGMVNPAYSPEGREMASERFRLGRAGYGQDAQTSMRGQIRFQERMNPQVYGAMAGLSQTHPLMATAAAVTDFNNQLGYAATAVSDFKKVVVDALMQISGGNGPSVPSGPAQATGQAPGQAARFSAHNASFSKHNASFWT